MNRLGFLDKVGEITSTCNWTVDIYANLYSD